MTPKKKPQKPKLRTKPYRAEYRIQRIGAWVIQKQSGPGRPYENTKHLFEDASEAERILALMPAIDSSWTLKKAALEIARERDDWKAAAAIHLETIRILADRLKKPRKA